MVNRGEIQSRYLYFNGLGTTVIKKKLIVKRVSLIVDEKCDACFSAVFTRFKSQNNRNLKKQIRAS